MTRIAWCSGGGQGYLPQAVAAGAELFFSGEVSEQTIHQADELGIHFIAAGHHATDDAASNDCCCDPCHVISPMRLCQPARQARQALVGC